MSFMKDADEVKVYLLEKGWVTSGQEVKVKPLSGGVSNQVWKIETPQDRWVMKQALAKLKVKTKWYSDVARIYREQQAMQTMASLVPKRAIPEIIHQDAENYTYMMSCAPEDTVTWKTSLLNGNFDSAVSEKVGRLLADIHNNSRTLALDTIEVFDDLTFFKQLRIEPFYEYLYKGKYPNLKIEISCLIRQLLDDRTVLVHGDFSPKNILVDKEGNVVLLDFEVAHWGNPVFDVAFCVAHFMLKGWASACYDEVLQMIHAFMSGYGSTPKNLQQHIGVMLLTRMDGKSPIDYITSEHTIEIIRQTGIHWITQPQDSDLMEQMMKTWKGGK
jgi:aminoglycoside phosphotransferase (APT) family kinase protein